MTEIRSKVHNYGNDKESDWPSQFGTGGKGLYKRCPVTGEMKLANEIVPDRYHYVIQDTFKEPVQSMTGSDLITDSKSALRQDYKKHGYVEAQTTYERKSVHNDKLERAADRKDDIERAYADVRYDKIKFSELEKETFKREDRAWQDYQKRRK